MNKVTIAGVDILVDSEEKYLQINDVYDLRESLWNQIAERYAGFDAVFCYHSTTAPEEFLASIGAVMVDDCVEMRLHNDETLVTASPDIYLVDDTSFDAFAALHDKRNPDMYWTSVRIRSDLARWGIVTSQIDGQITGYAMVAMWDPFAAEIFCIEASDVEHSLSLIIAAARYAFEAGKPEVLYMADKGAKQQTVAQLAGFCTTGFYQGYSAKVER